MCTMLCHTLEMFWKDGAIKKSNSEAMKMLIYFAGTKLERALKCPQWSGSKSGVRNTIQVSGVVARIQSLALLSLPPRDCIGGKLASGAWAGNPGTP